MCARSQINMFCRHINTAYHRLTQVHFLHLFSRNLSLLANAICTRNHQHSTSGCKEPGTNGVGGVEDGGRDSLAFVFFQAVFAGFMKNALATRGDNRV